MFYINKRMQIRYVFDADIPALNQPPIREAIEKAFAAGDILSCPCSSVEALVYPTRPPDFQVSISCTCSLMRPLFSSTPDTED